MIVHVLTEGEYEGYSVVGVFATVAGARATVRELAGLEGPWRRVEWRDTVHYDFPSGERGSPYKYNSWIIDEFEVML